MPRLLDLYCGAGGAAKGYADAGFEIVGVDINPQPNYPYTFIQADAVDYLTFANVAEMYDAVHASPPCQAYSVTASIHDFPEHPELIAATRNRLKHCGLPYVIENVMGARSALRDPFMLCGAMFPQTETYRHRLFEVSGFGVEVPVHPPHVEPQAPLGRKPKPWEWVNPIGNFSGVEQAREALGVQWMNRNEIAQAIPPVYTRHIGRFLRGIVR